ncbi:MAG: hypothetical protein M1812_002257 [Candelaria pacifica]|nr:MAG: hypothetical protein M1812_002257 [Candelaria pacifica]
MSSQVLSDRDVNSSAPQSNTQSSTSTNPTDNKPKSMDYHRQVLQSRLNGDEAKPQSLFGKQSLANSNSSETTKSSPFTNGDIKQQAEEEGQQ